MQPVIPAGSVRGIETTFTPEEVQSHLARVLSSTAFKSSRRCARFLEFIVRETLEGRSCTLKERTIATEVFDRSANWDSTEDTIVRVGAREVRKRLAQYYAGPESSQDQLRIELPLGSYVPELIKLDTTPAFAASAQVPAALRHQVVAAAPTSVLHAVAPAGGRSWRKVLIVLACCATVAFVCWRTFAVRDLSAFDVFWMPYFRSSEPIVVAVAHPLVYRPSIHAYQLNSKRFGPPPPGVEVPLKLPPEALNGADFVPVSNQFLAFGDAAAAGSIQLLLAVHHRETHVRFASEVQFADLRDGPSAFVGAFSNRWTNELTSHFRYHFAFDSDWIPAIIDSANPQNGWKVSERSDGTSPEDYFLIARIANSQTGMPMVIAAGVTQSGTEAAGRFIANPKLMTDVLRRLRSDWASRNLELVLHVRVIGNSPAVPDVVASYVW